MSPRVLLVIAGLIVVALAAVDLLRTTIGPSTGAGPISRSVFRVLWSAGVRVRCHRWAAMRWIGGLGTVVVTATITTWFALLWLGWTLVLMGSSDAVVSSATRAHASIVDRIYFAGTSLADLGNASYRPVPTGYELAVVGAAVSGLILLTLAITFVGPVVSAVLATRTFASQVHGLGQTPSEVAECLDSGGTFGAAQQLLLSLAGQLSQVAEQYRAYPLLVTFRARSRETATSPAVALLLESAIILGAAAPEDSRLPPSLLRTVLSSVEAYLDAAPSRGPQADPPPIPEVATVGAMGGRAASAFDRYASLRADALRHVLCDGWAWPGHSERPRA